MDGIRQFEPVGGFILPVHSIATATTIAAVRHHRDDLSASSSETATLCSSRWAGVPSAEDAEVQIPAAGGHPFDSERGDGDGGRIGPCRAYGRLVARGIVRSVGGVNVAVLDREFARLGRGE